VGFLYDKEETDAEIRIRYTRYVPAFVVLIVAYTLVLFIFQSPWATLVVGFASMLVIFRDQWTVRSMLLAARDEGRVTRSGRSWSMANPLTYHIAKDPSRRRPTKGTPRPKKKRR
jgi:type IV secretory pathway VirB3-like protein